MTIAITVQLEPPTLQNNTADADRLKAELKNRLKPDWVDIDFNLLKILPEFLRKYGYKVRCWLINDQGRWLLFHISQQDNPAPLAGLAIDLGTTRISLRLLNLLNGKILGETSFINPQVSVGPDILTRIHYAEKETRLTRLNDMIIRSLNDQISKLCALSDLTPEHIITLSFAGNTAMTHFFLSLSPRWMVREPYIPVVNGPGFVSALELGIKTNVCSRVFIFPNIGSYFGGDVIAGILFSGMNRTKETSLLVDVGTNAEVVLGNRDWMIACAGAAGPALEGSVTRMGMPAGPGVIDRVMVEPETKAFELQTINGLLPRGICGSGLIDLAAQLFLNGMIDNQGKFSPSCCADKLVDIEGVKSLVVVPGVTSATGKDLLISQTDLDSLFRSKAAMYAILETITEQVNISFDDLSRFYVAGTFGLFINPESAISIGMLPDIPLNRFHTLGNSSLGGATMVLKSCVVINEINHIKDRITYLELNVNQAFMNRMNAAKFLPHTDRNRFPSVNFCKRFLPASDL